MIVRWPEIFLPAPWHRRRRRPEDRPGCSWPWSALASSWWSWTAEAARERDQRPGRNGSYLCKATDMKDGEGTRKTTAVDPEVEAVTGGGPSLAAPPRP